MGKIKTDTKPLDDFFDNNIKVEDITEIIERKMWDLIFFELNHTEDAKSISFASDIYYLKCFVDSLKNCKTVNS